MKKRLSIVTAILAAVTLIACAHTSNVLNDVKIGMNRVEAIKSVGNKPLSYVQGSTEFILYRVGASFSSLYSDNPWTIFFVKLEDGKVVDKGVVGWAERRALKRIDPDFDISKLEAR